MTRRFEIHIPLNLQLKRTCNGLKIFFGGNTTPFHTSHSQISISIENSILFSSEQPSLPRPRSEQFHNRGAITVSSFGEFIWEWFREQFHILNVVYQLFLKCQQVFLPKSVILWIKSSQIILVNLFSGFGCRAKSPEAGIPFQITFFGPRRFRFHYVSILSVFSKMSTGF